MNRSELIRATAKRTGVTRRVADEIVTATLDVLTDALMDGQEIKLKRFGNIEMRQKQVRGVNFRTGEKLPSRLLNYLHFEPCDAIKEAINKGDGNNESDRIRQTNGNQQGNDIPQTDGGRD